MLEFKTKKLSYQIERSLEYIEVSKNIAVYRETKIINGEISSILEGITHPNVIKNISLSDEIQPKSEYDFMSHEVRELHREIPIGLSTGNYFSKYKDLMIKKTVYSYI